MMTFIKVINNGNSSAVVSFLIETLVNLLLAFTMTPPKCCYVTTDVQIGLHTER